MIALSPQIWYNKSRQKNIVEYPGRPAEPDGSHIKGVGITVSENPLVVPVPFLLPRIAYYGVKIGEIHMSTENTNMEQNGNATPAEATGGQKTFTQDDVNRIVQDRLAKDRAKTSEEVSKKEQELAAREFRLNSRQKLIDRGYPESIMEALNCSSEESFDKALDALDSLLKERGSTLEDMKARQNAARFTAPFGKHSQSGPDRIREAMRIQGV